MKLNPEPPEDFTNYNIIIAAAKVLAHGNEDEWAFFLNQLNNHTRRLKDDDGQGFIELMLKVRDAIKDRIDSPITPAEFYGEPPPFGDLPPTDKGDIPDAFRNIFDEEQ